MEGGCEWTAAWKRREEYEEVRRMQGAIEALLGDGESKERTEERLGPLRDMF